MAAASFSDYARVMLALPGTASQVAIRCGMTDSGVRRMLRYWWLARLVHPAEAKISDHGFVSTWHAGEGPAHENNRCQKPSRLRSGDVAFGVIWRCLEEGATVREIAEKSGVCREHVHPLIRNLKKQGQICVCGWQEFLRGRRAIWTFGNEKDVPKPPPGRRERSKCATVTAAMFRIAAAANQEREAA